MSKWRAFLPLTTLLLLLSACVAPASPRLPTPTPLPTPPSQTPATSPPPQLTTAPPSPSPTPQPPSPPFFDPPLALPVAKNLDVPWALDFLPDGRIVFTERAGRVRLINSQGRLQAEPVLVLADVAPRGEGGLLGIAVHPDFQQNQLIYIHYTFQRGASLANRVVRFRMQGNILVDGTTVLDNIPGATIHDGGRIRFGPEGLLYVITGDASVSNLAQDRSSLAGKILRLKDDGTIPPDNPFPGSPVYSLGHRNPQGLAWDAEGTLWATEHGSSATDELNLVRPGLNYGWPTIRGDETAPGLVSPAIHSGAATWAPSGMAFLDGSLFFAGLRGQTLFQVVVSQKPLELRRHLQNSYGRLRDVVAAPGRTLYLLTNNRDGRGSPSADDDQIIRVNPRKLP